MPRFHHRVNVAAQLAVSLFREADEWAAKGDKQNAQRALDAARAQLELAGVDGVDGRDAAEVKAEERVSLTAEEEAQRTAEETQALEDAAAAAAVQADRQALIEKLRAGDASTEEVQRALAALLGG